MILPRVFPRKTKHLMAAASRNEPVESSPWRQASGPAICEVQPHTARATANDTIHSVLTDPLQVAGLVTRRCWRPRWRIWS